MGVWKLISIHLTGNADIIVKKNKKSANEYLTQTIAFVWLKDGDVFDILKEKSVFERE